MPSDAAQPSEQQSTRVALEAAVATRAVQSIVRDFGTPSQQIAAAAIIPPPYPAGLQPRSPGDDVMDENEPALPQPSAIPQTYSPAQAQSTAENLTYGLADTGIAAGSADGLAIADLRMAYYEAEARRQQNLLLLEAAVGSGLPPSCASS